MHLTPDAARSLSIANAGGQSVMSEMLSIQYFTEIYGARDVILESEVDYYLKYKMVDYITTLTTYSGQLARVGVSVTRAMGYPYPERFTRAWADALISKKLYGLIVARDCVNTQHTFHRSILHCFCQTPRIAEHMREAYEALDKDDKGLSIRGDVLLVLTICDNPFIYSMDRPSNHARALGRV